MGVKPEGPDIFTVKGTYVECLSSSSHIYKITHDSCSCKGFGFRKLCRHYRQAQSKGFLDNLEIEIAKTAKITSNPYIKKMRMEAIKAFLDKYTIRYTLLQVVDLEKILTVTTTKQEVLGFFF